MESIKNEHKNESTFLKKDAIDPLQDGISSVELVRVSGSDLDIANAARVSYGKISESLSERDEKLINFLMEHNHTSPFEHNQLSFRIKAPIFIARQWMRHRMNSYNEISYRYVEAKTEFYIPKEFRFQDTVNKQSSRGTFVNDEVLAVYKKSLQASYDAYQDLLKSGVCREQARVLLPVATYTEFIFTCNMHSLMHFMYLRLASGAQKEIQVYAQALLQLASVHFPITLQAWQKKYFKEQEWQGQIQEWAKQLG